LLTLAHRSLSSKEAKRNDNGDGDDEQKIFLVFAKKMSM